MYAKRGTQEAFFGELAKWQDKPGIWFAGGGFNTNLLDLHPCMGHFSHTAQGTWRSSVKHAWCHPIDSFVGCGSLRPSEHVVGLHHEVTTQHAPLICEFPGELRSKSRLAWALPSPVSGPWLSVRDEAFAKAIACGDPDTWEIWVGRAFGLTGRSLITLRSVLWFLKTGVMF